MGPQSDSPSFALLSDAPLKGKSGDAFDLSKRLQPLYEAILNKRTETPFTIMVTGGWGSGKTSAMKWLDEHLRSSSVNGLQIDSCWFYPWKYNSKEDVWKGLIAEVILTTINFDRVDAAKVILAAKQFGKFLGGSFVGVLSALKVTAGAKPATEIEFDLSEALSAVTDEYSRHVTPQNAYYNTFERILSDWIKQSYRKSKNAESRLCIYIDDLDRCLPEVALQVLEAIKLYLNIPQLIFIVGVDKTVINSLVLRHYQDMLNIKEGGHDNESSISALSKAHQYLDKMFQVEVDIQPTDQQLTEFITQRLDVLDVWKHLSEEHRDALKGVIELMADLNPRGVVRALNTALAGTYGYSEASSIAHSIAASLVASICARKNDKYEQEAYRRKEGRAFFATWAYEIKASSQQEPENQSSNVMPLRLVTEYEPYLGLLDDKSLELLMRVGLPADHHSVSQLDMHRILVVVAGATGVAPSSISAGQLKLLKDLKLGSASDSDLESIGALENLSKLDLGSSRITDAGLVHLKSLERLTWLSLRYTGISSKSIESLLQLKKLRTLDASNTEVDDTFGVNLSKLERLTDINLGSTNVSTPTFRAIATLPALRVLRIRECSFGDDDAETISSLRTLQRLNIEDTRIGNYAFEALRSLSNLKSLYCGFNEIDDLCLISIQALNLETLWLDRSDISGAGLETIGKMTSLRNLSLDGLPIESEHLISLRGLSLKRLYLSYTEIDDSAIAELKRMRTLEFLALDHTNLTGAGLLGLKALHSLTHLQINLDTPTEIVEDLRASLNSVVIDLV